MVISEISIRDDLDCFLYISGFYLEFYLEFDEQPPSVVTLTN